MLRVLAGNRTNLFINSITLAAVLSLASVAHAAAQEVPDTRGLAVAVAECPPFVIFDNGQYSGLAIYLWERVGRELGLSWDYEKYRLGGLLEKIRTGDLSEPPDVGISCTSVTADREELIDFSHSFYETYTAIAVRQATLWSVVTGFLTSPALLRVVLIVLGIAAVIGAVFYLLERRVNRTLFSSESLLGRIIEPAIVGISPEMP